MVIVIVSAVVLGVYYYVLKGNTEAGIDFESLFTFLVMLVLTAAVNCCLSGTVY